MCRQKHKRGAFSLIEMVIVILILGIIAAVTAPRMFDTAAKAEENSTKQQLAILRNAIEMYRAQFGAYPRNNLLKEDLRDSLNGPFPIPQTGSARGKTDIFYDSGTDPAAAVLTDASGSAGWSYRFSDGRLKLNVATGDPEYQW
ncbi:MAG: prepilin-type N-terminal cleavage/methylation domain-containing protein [Planctomycetota bacterium]